MTFKGIDEHIIPSATKEKQGKYLQSKANSRVDAATRYREKHDNLETNYEKNKQRTEEKIDKIDDLLDASKEES